MVSSRSRFINLFSFHFSALIISIVLSSCSLILLPAQICLWISAVNFSCELLYFFSSRFFWFLLRFPVSLFIFQFCSYFAFLTFSPSSFSSLRIFKMIVLKFCLEDLPSGVFQGQLLLMYFFHLNGLYFPVFVAFFVVVVKNWTFGSNNVVSVEIRSSSFPGFAGVFCYCFLWLLQVVSVPRISLRNNLRPSQVFLSPCLSLGMCGRFLISPLYAVAFECPIL